MRGFCRKDSKYLDILGAIKSNYVTLIVSGEYHHLKLSGLKRKVKSVYYIP